MLKILEKCLQSNPELAERLMIQHIIDSCSGNDLRTISGKTLIN